MTQSLADARDSARRPKNQQALNPPPLVVAAHGSTDSRFAAVVESLAAQVRGLLADVDVRVGYLDHGPPDFAAVVLPTQEAHAKRDKEDEATSDE